jgi:hypothetical protein
MKPRPHDAAVHQPKERAMKKIEERSAAQSAEKAADSSKFMKSQSLRLDKQTIRTLTGTELRLVGGGCFITRTPHTD